MPLRSNNVIKDKDFLLHCTVLCISNFTKVTLEDILEPVLYHQSKCLDLYLLLISIFVSI